MKDNNALVNYISTYPSNNVYKFYSSLIVPQLRRGCLHLNNYSVAHCFVRSGINTVYRNHRHIVISLCNTVIINTPCLPIFSISSYASSRGPVTTLIDHPAALTAETAIFCSSRCSNWTSTEWVDAYRLTPCKSYNSSNPTSWWHCGSIVIGELDHVTVKLFKTEQLLTARKPEIRAWFKVYVKAG